MPLSAIEFTRETSYAPGVLGRDVFYANHPSGLCYAMSWLPDGWDTVGFQNAPCLITAHPGYGHSPGRRSTEPSSFGWFGSLCSILHARGWVIISLDYPPAPSNLTFNRDFIGYAYAHEQYMTFLRGLAWVKSMARPTETDLTKVALDEYSMHAELLGRDASGRVNTLDRNLTGVGGFSHGGTLSMFAAWFPKALFRRMQFPACLGSMDLYEPRFDHKPAFAISGIGQAAWTNYHVDPGTTHPLGEIYQGGVHQQFQRKHSGEKWVETPMHHKAAVSPLCYLDAGFPDNLNVPVYAVWGRVNGNNGSQIPTSEDDLYKVLDNVAGNAALWDPHNGIPWAKMIERRIFERGLGDKRSRIVWGNASNNPTGVTVDAAGGDGADNRAGDVAAWLMTHFGK